MVIHGLSMVRTVGVRSVRTVRVMLTVRAVRCSDCSSCSVCSLFGLFFQFGKFYCSVFGGPCLCHRCLLITYTPRRKQNYFGIERVKLRMALEGPELLICVCMGIMIFLVFFCGCLCMYCRDESSNSSQHSSDSSENTRTATRNNSISVNRVHIEENSKSQIYYPEGSEQRFERTRDL